jgi:NAD(P)-dependent dehydrogenase (short-subunit alcohol dehydrogenase family)
MGDMHGKTVLITGASGGIGLVAARDLARAGARVIMLVRSEERGEAARHRISGETGSEKTELLLADLADLAIVRSAADAFARSHDRLDVLIANAGRIDSERQLTVDGNERTFQVNHLAHFMLCQLLEPLLIESAPARVITVSSDAHWAAWRGIRFDDLTFERGWSPFGAYAHSKLANIMFCYEHARRLVDTGIVSMAVHPGLVRTGFGAAGYGAYGRFIETVSPLIAGTAEEGADTVTWLASAPDISEASGRYFHRRRKHRSSPASHRVATQRALWEVSEQLTRAEK